jgi:hypothetical protein
MHSYNPLTLPDTIAEITQKLPLKDLNKFCWINRTWYKEIQHELRKRWKIQVLKAHKLELEEGKKISEALEKYSDDKKMQRSIKFDIECNYIDMQYERAKKQVEIGECMLSNRMLYGQEREIVEDNIQRIENEIFIWYEKSY